MAHRAGARIANAEYVQFHPTALAAPGAEGLLISEAVRGEGGMLLTPELRPFMERYSPEWKDLAPRDVVARAIHHEMEAHGYSYVLLDIASHMPAEKIRERFPFIYDQCLKVGSTSHVSLCRSCRRRTLFCGGVLVDEWARSTIRNLYAVGEISCTGVHGANRLASTSLLEGLVWGNRAAAEIERALSKDSEGNGHSRRFEDVPPWDEVDLSAEPDPALIQGDMQTIQNIMWHYVGLVRSADRLSRAIRELRHCGMRLRRFTGRRSCPTDLIGLRNAVEVALIVAHSGAAQSSESRMSLPTGFGDGDWRQTYLNYPEQPHNFPNSSTTSSTLVLDREIHRRLPVICPGIHVSAVFDQQFDQFGIAVSGCLVKRDVIACRPRVHVCAVLDEETRDVRLFAAAADASGVTFIDSRDGMLTSAPAGAAP
jgi:aspartate oxidase